MEADGITLDDLRKQNPHTLEELDQIKAAGSDAEDMATPIFDAQLGISEGRRSNGDLPDMAWRMALMAALVRRELFRCPHVPGKDPSVANLATGVYTCLRPECLIPAAAAEKEIPPDDGHCDVCDAAVPDNFYIPHQVTLGATVVRAHVCRSCDVFVKARVHGAPLKLPEQYKRVAGRLRNEPCVCGSGVKTKKCGCPAGGARAAR